MVQHVSKNDCPTKSPQLSKRTAFYFFMVVADITQKLLAFLAGIGLDPQVYPRVVDEVITNDHNVVVNTEIETYAP